MKLYRNQYDRGRERNKEAKKIHLFFHVNTREELIKRERERETLLDLVENRIGGCLCYWDSLQGIRWSVLADGFKNFTRDPCCSVGITRGQSY